MGKAHVDSIQEWGSFTHEGETYCLGHLRSHELKFVGQDSTEYLFTVTYGLHCFTKDGTDHNIDVCFCDGRHSQNICLERYECSKHLRRILEGLGRPDVKLFRTNEQKYFTVELLNNLTGEAERYKVCVAFFKENRLMRIHVTSAFFVRTGEGSLEKPIDRKGFSLFKLAKDLKKRPRRDSGSPKEARNRHT